MVATEPEDPKRILTGIPGMDDVLHGGLPEHRIYLVEGYPGTGKTTLALQFLLEGVRRGEKVLYVTLSETKEEIEQVARSHGWSLEGVTLFELENFQDKFLEAQEQNSIFHPSEVELGETVQRIFAEVESHRPTRIALDSLSEMRLLASDPLRYRRQILTFKHFLTGRDCTVLMLDDRTAVDGDRQLQSICHGVVMLEENPTDHSNTKCRLRIVKLRGSSFQTGYHDYEIERGGIVVYPRLVAAQERSGNKAVAPLGSLASSGLSSLDELLGGGIHHGTSALVLGPAGSGKSSLMSQFILAGAERGENVACYLFEEGRSAFIHRSAGLNQDLEKHLKSGQLVIHEIDPSVLSPGQFSAMLRAEVEERHATLISIDSLNGYLNAMPTEKHLLLQMHELLSFLKDHGVLTIMVMAQHGLVGPMAQPIDLSYLADTVIMHRYFEAGGHVRKAISVLKKRLGFHEDAIRELQLSNEGLRIGDPLEQFQGILTGVPTFIGNAALLFQGNG